MPPSSHSNNNAPSPFRFSNTTSTPSRSVINSRDDTLPPTSAQHQRPHEDGDDAQFARAPKFSTRPKRQFDQSLTPRKSFESLVPHNRLSVNHNQDHGTDTAVQRSDTGERLRSRVQRQPPRQNFSTPLGDGFEIKSAPLKTKVPSRHITPLAEMNIQALADVYTPDQERLILLPEDLSRVEVHQGVNEDLDMLDYAPDTGQDEDMLDQALKDNNDEEHPMHLQAYPLNTSGAVVQQPLTFANPTQARPRSPSPKRPRLMPPPPPPSRQSDPTTQATSNRTTPHFAPAPRFAPPSSPASASQTTPQTPTSTRHRPFLPFLPHPSFTAQESENTYLLPNVFSPHRRKDRFLPGGLASRVRAWLVDESASSGTPTTITLLHTNDSISAADTAEPPAITTRPTTLTFHPETGLVARMEHVISSTSTSTSPSSTTTSTDDNNLQTSMHLLLASVPDPSSSTSNTIQTSTTIAKGRRIFRVLLSGSSESGSSIVSGTGAPQNMLEGGADAGDGARKLRAGVYVRLKTPVWKMPLGSESGLSSSSVAGDEGGGIEGADDSAASRKEEIVEWVVCARWSVL